LGVRTIGVAHESLPAAFVELDLADVSLEDPEVVDEELPSLLLDFDSDELPAFSDEPDDSLLKAFLRDSEG
jgi:hypothetical protein